MTVAAIIACEMIEDETLLALELAFPEGDHPPLVWVESALHERPAKLQAALQQIIDTLDEGARNGEAVMVPSALVGADSADEKSDAHELVRVEADGDIVLGFGYCGGGLKELVSRERRLIFPRADDCISLFLDGGCDRGQATRSPHSYYLTEGWLRHQGSMTDDYDSWVERYGLERAQHIRRLMFANYQRISLVDTGAYDVEGCLDRSVARAAELELAHEIVPGSVRLLERLFAGDWDSDIVVLEPGQPIGIEHLLCFDE